MCFLEKAYSWFLFLIQPFSRFAFGDELKKAICILGYYRKGFAYLLGDFQVYWTADISFSYTELILRVGWVAVFDMLFLSLAHFVYL